MANVTKGLTGIRLSVALGSLHTAAVAQLSLRLPGASVRMTGTVPQAGVLQLQAPALQLSLTGTTAVAGVLSIALPPLRLAMQEASGLTLALPPLQLAMTANTAVVADLQLNLPGARMALSAAIPSVGVMNLALPPLQFAASGVTTTSGRLSVTLRALTLAMSGYTGTVGSLVVRLPVVQLGLTGYGPISGYLNLVLPTAHLRMTGVPAAGTGATTLVMHTERGALSQYTNYPFNSFAVFNGVFLGASDDGVFALTGDTDNGAFIDAAARVGLTDFGTSHIKRVENVYLGIRTDGKMLLRVITEERWVRDYAIAKPNNLGLHGSRVKLGRGLEARYWQFELRNRDGSDFSLDIVEVKPFKLPRRVGGGNA